MCRKIVWCYVSILTLLDISLNTKLTAQGKTHVITVNDPHDSFATVNFQQWSKESPGVTSGAPVVRAWPVALSFGARALAVAHSARVVLTNTRNHTVHLASISGTTPDFYASFFNTKTLAPEANTSFNVVYLGRREGLVNAHLFLHTSLGVQRYSVSAEGVGSEWDLWPLVGARVPANATRYAALTVRNPTSQHVQIREVFSNAAWVGLQLAGGGASSWVLPPHGARHVLTLALSSADPGRDPDTPRLAYVRIKTNSSAAGLGEDGSLLVTVEAHAAPPDTHAQPLQLRLRTHGSGDPPPTFPISVGNSRSTPAPVSVSVWGARCDPRPAPRGPPPQRTQDANGDANGNGSGSAVGWAESPGVSVEARAPLVPPGEPVHVADLTLDFAAMWSAYVAGAGAGAGAAHCSGWALVAGAALPYSLTLVPGTLALGPPADFVSGSAGVSPARASVSARNEFARALWLLRLETPPDVERYFEVTGFTRRVLSAGESATVCDIRVRGAGPTVPYDAHLTLHTNHSAYHIPLRMYEGAFTLEWEWPNSPVDLSVGSVGVSQSLTVPARLRNPAPAPLCVTSLRADLPAATLRLTDCPAHAARDHPCWCVPGGSWAAAELSLEAPAAPGALSGRVSVQTLHAHTRARVTLAAHEGRVSAEPVTLPPAAPYAWSEAPLVVESSMSLRMRVTELAHDGEPAFEYTGSGWEVVAGRRAAGTLQLRPETACRPHCYTGLSLDTTEGAAWVSRASLGAGALRADAALAAARAALYTAARGNTTLRLHTTQVVSIPVPVSWSWCWPRLAGGAGAGAGGAGWAGAAAAGGAAALRLTLRNPAAVPLLLHALLATADVSLPELALSRAPQCSSEACEPSGEAFRLLEWRATGGTVVEWAGKETEPRPAPPRALPLLLLSPGAGLELRLAFAPTTDKLLSAWLYLRNNLTVVEAVQLAGRGVRPRLELAGRAPEDDLPVSVEVTECVTSPVKVSVVARNTGAVGVVLREWRVSGAACGARGWRLAACGPLHLAPNQSAALALSYAPDWTLARAAARLTLRSELGPHALSLRARVPAALLPRCAAAAPRPPFEPALARAGRVLAALLLVLVLAAAALDAERLLRRARARPAAPPRAPLDLRALAAPPAPPPPAPAQPPPPRKRRQRRLDPAAESRAFELWRASLRRDPDPTRRPARQADPVPDAEPEPDVDDDERPRRPDDDGASTGSDSSSSSSSSSSVSSTFSSSPEHEDADLEEHTSSGDAGPARDSPPPPPAPAPAERPRPAREPPRRPERRADGEPPRRAPPGKQHARKEKTLKRRAGATAPPTRLSPPAAAGPPPSSGTVREGASWSSVVALGGAATAPPPVPPVPRRPRLPPAAPAPPPRTDHSLFYYNGEDTAEYSWRAPTPPAVRDFLGGSPEAGEAGSFSMLGGVWRAPGAGWAWPRDNLYQEHANPHGAVRPPPGFGTSPPSPPPMSSLPPPVLAPQAGLPPPLRPVRPYDPFQSLPSIWSRTALDWREDTDPPDH